MVTRRRLVRYYAIAVVGAMVLFTVAYDAGMTYFEGEPRTVLESFEIVLQTLTTTGYGQDAAIWGTEMRLLVVGMEISSLVLIFAAFPIVIVPLVEDALKTAPPTTLDDRDLADHVIVCGHSPNTETLLDELDANDLPSVIVEPDREVATDLFKQGLTVVHNDPESIETLSGVNVEDARAVVSDSDDDVDLSIVMSAKELAPDVPVYSIVEEPGFAGYHEHAGVDEVFSPRTLLGRGLANKVRTAVTADLGDAIEVGKDISIGELPVSPGSDICGQTVAEADLDEHAGVTLLGVWSTGEFRTPPFPDLLLDEHSVLLVVGTEKQLERFKKRTRSQLRGYSRGEVLIVGSGVVGTTVNDALAESDIDRTVIDIEPGTSVDVVGDATDPSTLRSAGIDDARTVILALDDDTTTLLTTFVIRDINPDVEIVARAEETANVRKLYRAGADYVLALASVTGRLLASTILDDEEVISFDKQVEVVRVDPGSVAGSTLGEANVRERTGCTVIAVERRDGRVDTHVGGHTEIGPNDKLVIAGIDGDIAEFNDVFR